uniref:Limiting CO2-inducible protein B/C beta carbonyic anhydrase domain-containing protein n=1 Tax=Skeletonema marinoi TaxID=267567 RepID=A0A7S2M1M8_9STRA
MFTTTAAAFLALSASTAEAFAPSSSTTTNNVRSAQQPLQMSYLDSLAGAQPLSFTTTTSSSSPPSTFGELLSGDDMNDLCAFNAASLDIQSTISSNGGITAAQIQDSIRKANEVVSIIRQNFPGAMGSSEILERVKRVLDIYNADNILLTQSVCPDEINHEHGDITDLFIENIGGGKVFHLGGLAGVPFTGKTGFGAYSAHVADGGHAFVLQAPHIGMSDDLELGKYSREGQDHAGSACGAAVGAMCHCMAGNPMPDLATATADWQMNFLIQEIGKRMPALNACAEGNEKQAELARQTHQIGKDMLEQCLSTDFGDADSMLFVMTGIQINMPFEFEDYFQPLSFEVRKKDGSVVDLYQEAFGSW